VGKKEGREERIESRRIRNIRRRVRKRRESKTRNRRTKNVALYVSLSLSLSFCSESYHAFKY
jgi:hypothetical protein